MSLHVLSFSIILKKNINKKDPLLQGSLPLYHPYCPFCFGLVFSSLADTSCKEQKRGDQFCQQSRHPLQCTCLESPMDGGAWWAAVHEVTKSRTRLSDFTFTHWRRKWQPTSVFLPGESQGQGSLVGCRLWGRTESDTTEAT